MLPAEEVVDNARLDGLRGEVRGDVRVRICDLVADVPKGLREADLADRSDSFTLGRKGVARGDGVWLEFGCAEGEFPGTKYCDCARRQDGEDGADPVSELLCEAVRTSENLEGERDNERLRVRKPA